MDGRFTRLGKVNLGLSLAKRKYIYAIDNGASSTIVLTLSSADEHKFALRITVVFRHRHRVRV